MKSFSPSKRGLLSFISSAFDPFPFLILQQLWKISLDWDEEIPLNLKNCWLKWLQIKKH